MRITVRRICLDNAASSAGFLVCCMSSLPLYHCDPEESHPESEFPNRYTKQMSLLRRLAEIKGQFGDKAAGEAIRLLELAKSAAFRGSEDLIQLHESVLYLRAYPQTPRVLELADEILFEFANRVRGIDRTPFEYADISGIAGTGLATNFSYPFARSLAE